MDAETAGLTDIALWYFLISSSSSYSHARDPTSYLVGHNYAQSHHMYYTIIL